MLSTPNRFGLLRVRLPAAVALLLALCTGAMLVVSYRVVRSTVIQASLDRMHSAGDRVSSMLAASVPRAATDLARVGALPSIDAWLHGGADADAARTKLDSVRKTSPGNTAVSLVRADGQRLVAGDPSLAQRGDSAGSAPVGPFFSLRDTIRYSVAAGIAGGRDTIGHVRVTRSLAANNATSQLLGGFVGRNGSVLIANADGSVWTDFSVQVQPVLSGQAIAHARANGGRVVGDTLAAIAAIAGTPWIVWVGQPAGPTLSAATDFLHRLAWLAAIVVMLGALVAWIAIDRFTRPLNELVGVSEALAAGTYDRRSLSANRRDEVGRVATAFNAMAARIEAHNHTLEEQVRERTAALERAQEALLRRERLATLGKLAGGVGHELRNPLGVMTNAVYVLDSMVQPQSPMVTEYLGILRGQIALSEKIVADLLDFARTKPVQRAPVALSQLVSQQIARLGPTDGLVVACDVPASLPPLSIDATQIGQVVFNLLTNAVQAMQGRVGAIRCSARHDMNGSVVFDVEDDGPGMPADVASRVFEPLFTTKARGLGLGLAVSKMLAENNSGTLSFSTEAGHGTTFTLRLPIEAT